MSGPIRDIQQALKDAGFDPGPIDGVSGRLTIRAIREFQQSRFLDVDGIIGPLTAAKLFPTKPRSGLSIPLPWYDEATHLLGLKEGRGAANNPVILDWADDLDIAYPSDATAWCGLFCAHCIGSTLPEEVLPTNPLGARNWLTFGVKCEPQHAAILVFWREAKKGWKGHVGIYQAERADAYKIRGGNQSDSVSDAWIAKNRLLGARWPKTVPFLATGKLFASDGSVLSTNEA